jgi:hypothetical protein
LGPGVRGSLALVTHVLGFRRIMQAGPNAGMAIAAKLIWRHDGASRRVNGVMTQIWGMDGQCGCPAQRSTASLKICHFPKCCKGSAWDDIPGQAPAALRGPAHPRAETAGRMRAKVRGRSAFIYRMGARFEVRGDLTLGVPCKLDSRHTGQKAYRPNTFRIRYNAAVA